MEQKSFHYSPLVNIHILNFERISKLFSGVLNSCDIFARNSDLYLLLTSNCFVFCSISYFAASTSLFFSSKEISDSSVFLERPNAIEDEMFRLSVDAIGSEQIANFAVKELLPLLASDQIKEASQIIIENFEKYKKEKENDHVN